MSNDEIKATQDALMMCVHIVKGIDPHIEALEAELQTTHSVRGLLAVSQRAMALGMSFAAAGGDRG